MSNRLTLTAVLLTIAGAAAAQPAGHDSARRTQEPRHSPVVLASADAVRTPPTSQASTAPAKPIVPRVTTCRCGDPQSDADSDPDAQDQ